MRRSPQGGDPLGLYLHIPFCTSICNYCNFNRGLFDAPLKASYVHALVEEVRAAGDGAPVDTVYFGGGTPSLLEPEEIAALIAACGAGFDLAPDAEVTLEANPETVHAASLRGWMDAGVNRVSLGVQTLLDTELLKLGRRHSAARAREAIGLAHAAGCDFSADLMLWLPAQSREDCAASVAGLLDLQPTHVSFYLLELYPNAPLREEMARAGWSQAPDDDAAAMYLDTLARTDAAGYEQYEISNVARPGKRCRHNLKYWQDGAWLGFGCGAHSTRAGRRWRNVAETRRYVDMVERGQPPTAEHRELTPGERLGDALFTGLRVVDGIDLDIMRERYGVDVMARYGASLEPYLESGWLLHESGRLKLTRQGMLLANEVMGTFV
ncbi:MAG: radical SAM family heme chaperone HemW [Acidobacteria bacterium]|nr:radical SAM family heme chaperone HemW [Acidobacteriota bacterium]